MLHPRLVHRMSLSAMPLVLSFSVLAAEPLLTGAFTSKQAPPPVALDLRTPPIQEILTQAQIDEVLARTFEPRHLEGVEVDRSRINDPNSEDYIPPGFAALFWAAGRPSGLWKLFTPMLAQKARDDINPTNPSQPAPGIPAMAGEGRPFDR